MGTGCCPCNGCWSSGPTRPSRCGWRRSAGGSSTTIASSNTAWVRTTSKDAPGADAPPRHARHRRPRLPHLAPAAPKSPDAGLTFYQVLDIIQDLLNCWTGICATCHRLLPMQRRHPVTTRSKQT
ncbi:hypothetical protein DN069_20840 [Streptacidiphilus pinicola]|uniref:Uncharacterized protein n=1 Tax=Streptacidiphilus pinicola TaxID=2219663 RepID=A0A2X0IJA0_9ACTN|nr:hypothetical protein DN069_20840 [Streptacidiphilus pinicola]